MLTVGRFALSAQVLLPSAVNALMPCLSHDAKGNDIVLAIWIFANVETDDQNVEYSTQLTPRAKEVLRQGLLFWRIRRWPDIKLRLAERIKDPSFLGLETPVTSNTDYRFSKPSFSQSCCHHWTKWHLCMRTSLCACKLPNQVHSGQDCLAAVRVCRSVGHAPLRGMAGEERERLAFHLFFLRLQSESTSIELPLVAAVVFHLATTALSPISTHRSSVIRHKPKLSRPSP